VNQHATWSGATDRDYRLGEASGPARKHFPIEARRVMNAAPRSPKRFVTEIEHRYVNRCDLIRTAGLDPFRIVA
jgi:hypothetical protein